MTWFRLLSTAFAVALFLALPATAQQPQPGLPLGRLEIVMPCGAKAGSTVEVQLTGSDLDEAKALIFSHPGITAQPVEGSEPKADPKEKKDQPPRRKGPPAGAPAGRFKVSVAPNVPVGQYDVRVVHKWGVTNPRFFCVGDLNEVMEKEPNNDVGEAQRIEINTTINGAISTPSDVDYSIFTGKKGQRVVISCLTSSIDSRARPMLEVIDATSNLQIASNRNYNGNDALTDVILPHDGDYLVRLSEFTYTQGGPQYFYRLSVSTAPWIDAVYPPMVEPGKPAKVTLYGRNLPGGSLEPGALVDGRPVEKLEVTISPPTAPADKRLDFHGRVDLRSAPIDGFEYRFKGPNGISNPMLISFATAKVVLEQEPNDKPDSAQKIAAPCEVAGRIDKRQDRDWYAFEAKKGDVFMIELFGDRIGTPVDLFFTLKKDSATNEIEEDDNQEIMQQQQFFNRTSDPRPYRFVAAENGRYLIGVGSRESNFSFGPRIVYRLRVAPEVPDYRLFVMAPSTYLPETTVLRAGGHQYFDVFVQRLDGFNGSIALKAEGLPPGVTCPPALVSAGMKQGTLVLSAAAGAAPFDGPITVTATAMVNGKELVRQARPATITWGVPAQNNFPTVARLDQGVYVAIRDKAQFKVDLEIDKAFVKKGDKLSQPILVKAGDKVTVPFKITRQPDSKTPITLQQISMGVQNQQSPISVSNGQPLPPVAPDKNDGELTIDVKTTAAPGDYAVVLKASASAQAMAGKRNQNVTATASTIPIIIKVLPASVARVTAAPKANLKPGTNGELTVKVERQFDYAGEFKVKVVLPASAKGITVTEATIPAGKDEVIVALTAAADAPPATLSGIVVQATALLEGKVPTVHETKFNLIVDKVTKDKK
jgi:hypothetical protein